MKNFLKWLFLAGAITCSSAPVHAETPKNVCNSDIAVKNAKNRVFALIQGFETKKNRLTLCKNGEVVMTSKISTGKPAMRPGKNGVKTMRGSYTPEGNFSFGERVRTGKTSNLYNGKNGNPAPLPYWQRFTGAIGFHKGDTSGPSAGCVRVQGENAKKFYNAVSKIGPNNVEVIVQWTNPHTKNDGK